LKNENNSEESWEIGSKIVFFSTIILILIIMALTIYPLIHYDGKCLDKIANRVCIEKGYAYGEHKWDNRDMVIYCYKDYRESIWNGRLKFTKLELNECKRW